MTMTPTSLLQFEVTDQVATITFDSPSKRNALEPAMREELAVAKLRHPCTPGDLTHLRGL